MAHIDATAAAASSTPFDLEGYQLPSFSGVVLSALGKVRDRNCDAGEVAALLESDPGVTVKLLSLANSACYGLRRRVDSAAHAVSLLGRAQVESLLLAVGIGGALPSDPIPELDSSRFWCAAARRASIARAIAGKVDQDHISESFTAALLQDMGVPLLAQRHPEAYGALLGAWRSEATDLAALEREQFGYDHPMVGSWMCQQWRVSELIMRAIGAHHGVWEETDLPAVTLVGALNDGDSDYGQEALTAECEQRYKLTPDVMGPLLEKAELDAADTARMFA